jgi:VanZ family protein
MTDKRRTRSTPAILWLVFALMTIYGATIPFHFTEDRGYIVDKLSHVRLNPFISPDTGRRVSVPDVVQNVFLFVPFGFFGYLTLVPRRRTPIEAMALAVVAAALLSVGLETLQLFTTDRTSSLSDVVANTIGACGGTVLSRMVADGARRWGLRRWAVGLSTRPAFYPLMIATVVLCIAAWEPFDASLDIGTLVSKGRALIFDPWQGAPVIDQWAGFVTYLLFTIAASLWLRAIGVQAASVVAAMTGVAVAIVLEGSELIVQSRMPGLQEATVHVTGALVGAGLGRRWPHGRSRAFWGALFWMAIGLGAAVQACAPPFIGNSEPAALQIGSCAMQLVLLYFLLGFACPLIMRDGWRAWWLSVAGMLSIALPVEYLHGALVSRYRSVDVALATVGTLAGTWGAGPGWRIFRSRVAESPAVPFRGALAPCQ